MGEQDGLEQHLQRADGQGHEGHEGHEGRAEGRAEGHREGMLDMVRSLFTLKVPIEVIEKSSGLTRAEILALQDAPAK